jgi:hypothetical protein
MRHFAHNDAMENDPRPPSNFKDLVQWATKPPQVYAVYLVGLILVWGVSFYAGTLNPRKTQGQGTPTVFEPRK